MQEVSEQTNGSKKFRKILWIFFVFIIVALVIYYFVCGITYSKGTRSGVLTKVSEKGFVFKTGEGELNIGGLNQGDGTIMPTNTFSFSVSDTAVYRKLEKEQGKKIILHYKERIKSFFWQGETNYFIYQVTMVE